MRRLLTTMTALGLAATTGVAFAQGPVREGLRRTGEIAAQGTQRVIEGTGRVIQGTGQAARNVTGAAVEGTRRGVDAVTPGLPAQARADARLSTADQRRDARWRFARHNGEWWYYSPENQWMYHRDGQWNQFSEDQFQPLPQQGQRYSMGYRGVDDSSYSDQSYYSQQIHQVRTDRWGRQYICENGRPVYLDQSAQQPAAYEANRPELADQPIDYAPPRPAEADAATGTATTPGAEAQAELQDRGVATDDASGNADAAGNSPEAPREINNNPAPSQGTDSQTGAARVQTPQ